MPAPENTLLIEGTFGELTSELVEYIDTLRKAQNESSTSLKDALSPLIEAYNKAEEAKDEDAADEKRDEILKHVVDASGALNTCPEREFLAAYNLLIHLVHQSTSVNRFLQPICQNLSAVDGSSSSSGPSNRFALALSALSTVFNVLQPDDAVRYPVFSAILEVIGKSGSFDTIRPQLRQLEGWLNAWEVNDAQQRKMYLRVAKIAKDSGEEDDAYAWLVRALRTIASSDAAGSEARTLSLQALKAALDSPTHYDFEDLTSLDSVQALRNSDPVYFQLLEVFTADDLTDYQSFKEEHSGWIEEQGMNDDSLTRKMRLLTLASLAASTGQTRSLPYASISDALQIPADDVEMWVIDVIRAGLVEGKLSQLNQTFLIHRSTYRVFSENQWREVSGRLDMWRASLRGVLEVIQQEKENMIIQREQELRQLENKTNGVSGGGGGGRRYRSDANNIAADMGLD